MSRHLNKNKNNLGTPSPHLSPEQAEKLLNNIMQDLDINEEPIPSKSHPYYFRVLRKYIIKNALVLGCVFLLLFLAMPGTVIPASVSHVSAAPSTDKSSAKVEFEISSLFPVQQIKANMNNKKLEIQETGFQHYSVDIKENGYLLLEIYSATGLYSSHGVEIDSIDDKAPHIISHQLEGDNIKVYISDSGGVGIDYSSIITYVTGTHEYQKPVSYDSDAGYVVFNYPESTTYITITDKNGNQMTAVLSPPGGSS